MAFAFAGVHCPARAAPSPVLVMAAGSAPGFQRRGVFNLSLTRGKINHRFLGTTIVGRSCDKDYAAMTVSASGKVLVPGSQSDDVSSSSDPFGKTESASHNLQVLQDESNVGTGDDAVPEEGDEEITNEGVIDSIASEVDKKPKILEKEIRRVPPTGNGQKIYEIDPNLRAHRTHLDYRYSYYRKMREMINQNEGGLESFSRGYEKFGFIRSENGISYREWAPGATSAALVGDFNNWNPNANVMARNEFGVWEIFLPNNADGTSPIPHGSRVKIRMDTPSGIKDSIPAWIKFSVQAPGEIPYNGIYYDPPEEEKYVFQHPRPKAPKSLRVYESHIGMSSQEPRINTYANFRDDVLPRIKRLGYNAVQIMAIQEHSYYASFGYHVTNFFAPSSRFGTPEDLKSLIDKAHELGLLVLMDIVHRYYRLPKLT